MAAAASVDDAAVAQLEQTLGEIGVAGGNGREKARKALQQALAATEMAPDASSDQLQQAALNFVLDNTDKPDTKDAGTRFNTQLQWQIHCQSSITRSRQSCSSCSCPIVRCMRCSILVYALRLLYFKTSKI